MKKVIFGLVMLAMAIVGTHATEVSVNEVSKDPVANQQWEKTVSVLDQVSLGVILEGIRADAEKMGLKTTGYVLCINTKVNMEDIDPYCVISDDGLYPSKLKQTFLGDYTKPRSVYIDSPYPDTTDEYPFEGIVTTVLADNPGRSTGAFVIGKTKEVFKYPNSDKWHYYTINWYRFVKDIPTVQIAKARKGHYTSRYFDRASKNWEPTDLALKYIRLYTDGKDVAYHDFMHDFGLYNTMPW